MENGQNIKNAMCYIPAVAFVLYFTEEKKSEQFEKHIRYGMVLFVVFIILFILFRSVFNSILVLAYIGVSIYLGYKSYIEEDLNFKFIDDIFVDNKGEKKGSKKQDKEDEKDVFEDME